MKSVSEYCTGRSAELAIFIDDFGRRFLFHNRTRKPSNLVSRVIHFHALNIFGRLFGKKGKITQNPRVFFTEALIFGGDSLKFISRKPKLLKFWTDCPFNKAKRSAKPAVCKIRELCGPDGVQVVSCKEWLRIRHSGLWVQGQSFRYRIHN